MKTIRTEFGKRIRLLRESKKISQEELGFRSGLHRTYIGSVERGERNISINAIEKIATALDIQIWELFRGVESNTAQRHE